MLASDVTVAISVSDVYGRPMEALGAHLGRRQQFTEFRVIKRDEENVTFLGLNGQIIKHQANDPLRRHGGPRLVVTTRPGKKFEYVDAGVDAIPAFGQPYLTNDGTLAFGTEGMTEKFPIMSMTVQEVA